MDISVSTDADSGRGSLRWAIDSANAYPGSRITFNAKKVYQIRLQSPLPPITAPETIIDGSEPGAVIPSIMLCGKEAGHSSGLLIFGDRVQVIGLSIVNFARYGVECHDSVDTKIRGCRIGVNNLGSRGMGNGLSGIAIFGGSGCMVGGDTKPDMCVVSSNLGHGIEIVGRGTNSRHVIRGCLIGTSGDGKRPFPNGGYGVEIANAPNNVIENSTISSNHQGGILVDGSARKVGLDVDLFSGIGFCTGNVISNNMIGLNKGGSIALGNGGFGVTLKQCQYTTIIGNTIAANFGGGICLLGSEDTTDENLSCQKNSIDSNVFGLSKKSKKKIPNKNIDVYGKYQTLTFIGYGEKRNVFSDTNTSHIVLET